MSTSLKAPLIRLNLLARRVIAFCTDYLIFASYAVLLFVVVSSLDPPPAGPIRGQIIAFFSLTLPVVLYGIVLEGGPKKATIGKRWMRIEVVGDGSVVFRNILKFLPWEIAHGGVHWMYYYEDVGGTIPGIIWILLVLPQVVVVVYVVSILVSRGRSSVYDKMAKTEIKATVEMV